MADFANVQPDEYKLLGCNYSAGRPFGIKGVTIHHMAGDLNADQCNGIWGANGCSAHYSVDRNGYIVQHVNDTDRAYACGDGIGSGGGNDTTISIEHANSARGPWTVHEAAIESGAHLVAALCLYYGLGRPAWMVNVFPHKHWSSTACPGELAGSQRDHYMQRAMEWYDAMVGGTQPSAPTVQPVPAPAAPSASQGAPGGFPSSTGVRVPVHYSLHLKGGGWLDEVTDFGSGDDGFAGYPCRQHDLLCTRVDRGTLKYQVHTIEDGWLDYVTKGDRNDTVNGCAGIAGHTIDGVRMYYVTPDGEEYKQAWYRSQTTARAGWLDTVCDDGTTYGGDDFAGILGEPLDRLQVCVTDGVPW